MKRDVKTKEENVRKGVTHICHCHPDIMIGKGIWKIFEHNKKSHSIKFIWKGKIHYFCARCTGQYLGILLALIFSITFLLFNKPFLISGGLAFVVAWLLALPAIIDWSTSKLSLRYTNNIVRGITGFLLGNGIVIYFWTGFPLLYILVSLLLYKTVTILLVSVIYLMKKGGSLSEIGKQQIKLLKILVLAFLVRFKQTNFYKYVIEDTTGGISRGVARGVGKSLASSVDCGDCCGECCGGREEYCCACCFCCCFLALLYGLFNASYDAI